MAMQLGVGHHCLLHLYDLLNDVLDWLPISDIVQTCNNNNLKSLTLLQVHHEESSSEIPKSPPNYGLNLKVVLKLEFSLAPYIIQGAGS